jgi:hypothetical protein
MRVETLALDGRRDGRESGLGVERSVHEKRDGLGFDAKRLPTEATYARCCGAPEDSCCLLS